ncbi:MAG: hypothetical protein IJ242_04245 [Clostridia bacterium]|nr:hypothetical protein [Clostridia bacterium]
MKKLVVLCLILCQMLIVSAFAETADPVVTVKPSPSALLVQLVGGKTMDAYLNGYGWGGDIETYTFSFRIAEPVVYAAADVEQLAVGSVIVANYSDYKAVEIEKDGDTVVIKPEEEWQEPLKLSKTADGNGYNAETEGRILMQDAYQFECRVNPAFEFTAADGSKLAAEPLMDKLSEGEMSLDDSVLEVTFDNDARLLSIVQK